MGQCYNSGDFKKYFNENMQDLGLPAPSTLFDTYQTAIGTALLLGETLSKLGKGATMGELVGATFGLEKLKIAAALGAAGYTGAVIGSIAVASGRSLGCGSRMADMFAFVPQNNLQFRGWNSFYAHNPKVLDRGNKSRRNFGLLVRSSPTLFEYA